MTKFIIKLRPKPSAILPYPVEHWAWEATGIFQKHDKRWSLPNNIGFLDWINDQFYQYRLEEEGQVVTKNTKDLFLYQEFITKYMCPESPYRGILIFHKLGSGKTRTAIATAEAFRKAGFRVVVLLPASLKNNFIDEVKTWANSDLSNGSDAKIEQTYRFVSYNANTTLAELRKIEFRDTIVIIDEVHNLLNMMTSSQSKQGREIYKILMGAKNCRFLALSGTPLLNFGYELGLLFNILRGYMTYETMQQIPLFPEDEAEFEQYFVDYGTEQAKNIEVFKRRIVGLVSYYCGIQEELYPDLILHEPIRVEMSGFQFSQYWQVRQEEIATEAKRPFKDRVHINQFGDKKPSQHRSKKYLVSNTFRPNSRQYCNFTFPEGICRPKSLSKITKDVMSRLKLDANSDKWTPEQTEELNLLFPIVEEYDAFVANWALFPTRRDGLNYLVETVERRGFLGKLCHIVTREEETLVLAPETQELGTKRALNALSECQDRVLSSAELPTYSAKMAEMVRQMHAGPGHEGKKFVYSNFRTLEGVEIFSRVLQVQGYTRFDPAATNTSPAKRYAFITGTESLEARREVLKAFNKDNNAHGEYLMVILGTSSAAEGISLRHVRQIHIMEPWWNEVRLQQVIGRGRRIGSHEDLPERERNVHVYQYLSVLSPLQREALKGHPKEWETTDEHIFNKAQSKARINRQFLHILKEAAIDTILNGAHNQNIKNDIIPLTVSDKTKWMYVPILAQEPLLQQRPNISSDVTQIRYAPFDLIAKGLVDPKTKRAKYVSILDGKGNYRLVHVYNRTDTKRITYPAYALYDRVTAETSNRFLLRFYLVDKMGLVSTAEMTEK